jgi:hypothetical protein
MTYIPSDVYLTQEINIYIYGVGISTVFQISDHFLYHGGRGPLCMAMTYTPSAATVFEIFGHLLFKGDGTISFGHDLNTI